MAQNVKKVASKNLKKPKVAENSKSCRKVAEQLVAKPTSVNMGCEGKSGPGEIHEVILVIHNQAHKRFLYRLAEA